MVSVRVYMASSSLQKPTRDRDLQDAGFTTDAQYVATRFGVVKVREGRTDVDLIKTRSEAFGGDIWSLGQSNVELDPDVWTQTGVTQTKPIKVRCA